MQQLLFKHPPPPPMCNACSNRVSQVSHFHSFCFYNHHPSSSAWLLLSTLTLGRCYSPATHPNQPADSINDECIDADADHIVCCPNNLNIVWVYIRRMATWLNWKNVIHCGFSSYQKLVSLLMCNAKLRENLYSDEIGKTAF